MARDQRGLVVVEALEDRAREGGRGEGPDRVRLPFVGGKRLEILRLPHVEIAEGGEEPVEIDRFGHAGQRRRIDAAGKMLLHQVEPDAVRGLAVLARDLHRQRTAGGQETGEPRKEGGVIRDPMQRGVRKDQRLRALRSPCRDIGLVQRRIGPALPRLVQHGR